MHYNVNDVPISSLDDDAFSIQRYVVALSQFITTSDMPETIAIRGEWGSGKTSFMKMLESRLTNNKLPSDQRFDSIWLNTWQLFAQDDQKKAIANLYLDLAEQLTAKIAVQNQKHHSGITKQAAMSTLRDLSNIVLNLANIETESLDRIWNDFGHDDQSRVFNVRQKLEALITSTINEKENGVTDKGFLIFVDDLDRLQPQMAVTLLEALKNLFDIHGCVFVLGIDYEVIRLGVDQKYGLRHVNGRDLSQDFFDKIVQLPFVLPTAQYDVMPMVMHRLEAMAFLHSPYQYAAYGDLIRKIIVFATKNNPRTIKTIMNVLQITLSISGFSKSFAQYRLILLLLVSLNKVFPEVYEKLAEENDISLWKATRSDNEPAQSSATDKKQVLRKTVAELIGSSDPGEYAVNRACGLLDLFVGLQKDCETMQVPVDDLFDTVNTMSGLDNVQPAVTVNGAEYVHYSHTEDVIGSHLLQLIDLNKHHRVLDVGCASGNVTLNMWSQNRSLDITAIDISKSQIEQAVEQFNRLQETLQSGSRGEQATGRVAFRVQDAQTIRVKDKYDLIFSNCVLHWIAQIKMMYARLYGALIPGGELAVVQGGKGTYRGLHANARKAIRNLNLEDKFKNWNFPAYFLESETIEKILHDVGFVNVTVESRKYDHGESPNLLEDFTVASLIYYRAANVTDDEFTALKSEFTRICTTEGVDLYSHDLFIHAFKPL